jgi:hypothetical protein
MTGVVDVGTWNHIDICCESKKRHEKYGRHRMSSWFTKDNPRVRFMVMMTFLRLKM